MALTKATYAMIDGAVVNVRDYGATGGGTVDDTAAINAAIAACGNGGQVFFPAGTYRTTANITVANVCLIGVGEASIIKPDAAVNSCLILNGTSNAATGFPWKTELKNLFVEGENTTGKTGILIGPTATSANYIVNNVTVNRFAGSGGYGIKIVDAVYTKIEDCELARCDVNLYIKGTGTNPTTTAIDNCYIRAATPGQGCFVENAWQVTFRNCVFEANRAAGVRIAPAVGFNAIQAVLENCWFEDNQIAASPRTSAYALELDGSAAGVTLTCDLRNVFFGITVSTEKAIYAANLFGSSWQNIENRNVADSIAITGLSNNAVTVLSAPSNYTWALTVNSLDGSLLNSLPALFGTWTAWTPTITGAGSMAFSITNLYKARYRLNGKTCTVVLNFDGTTSGTASGYFIVPLPSGIQAADSNQWAAAISVDATVNGTGYVQAAGAAGLHIGKLSGNYSLGGANGARCSFTFEIQ